MYKYLYIPINKTLKKYTQQNTSLSYEKSPSLLLNSKVWSYLCYYNYFNDCCTEYYRNEAK